jgi:hypothetical protein
MSRGKPTAPLFGLGLERLPLGTVLSPPLRNLPLQSIPLIAASSLNTSVTLLREISLIFCLGSALLSDRLAS